MPVSELEKKPESKIRMARIPNSRPRGASFNEGEACMTKRKPYLGVEKAGAQQFVVPLC
jgi:hypothetical protein